MPEGKLLTGRELFGLVGRSVVKHLKDSPAPDAGTLVDVARDVAGELSTIAEGEQPQDPNARPGDDAVELDESGQVIETEAEEVKE